MGYLSANKYEERNNLPCGKIIALEKRYMHIMRKEKFD